jgi:hypothetical protein
MYAHKIKLIETSLSLFAKMVSCIDTRRWNCLVAAFLLLYRCSWIGCKVTSAADPTSVPLIPFKIWIEWTISSPDLLYQALTEYLEDSTGSNDVVLEEVPFNVTIGSTTEPVPIVFLYIGTADVTTDYGVMTQPLLQQQQRIALQNREKLQLFLQFYFDQATHPYNSSITVHGIELMLSPEHNDSSPSSDDSSQQDSDNDYKISWFTVAFVCAGAVCVALIIVVIGGFMSTMTRRWEEKLSEWKYSLERERELLRETHAATTNTTSRDETSADDGPHPSSR